MPLILPLDVLHDIFQLTARAYPARAPSLALVCSTVQDWVERVIYETVVLELPVDTTRLFLRTFYSRPPAFFADRVKHLYLTSIITFVEARRLISACSGVYNLVCWADPHRTASDSIAELLPPKHIKRLSIKVEALWGPSPPSTLFSTDLFSQLTHLEIVNPPGHDSPIPIDWDGLTNLPDLTHLAFGDLWHWAHTDFIPYLKHILDHCPHLHALVAITRDNALTDTFRQLCLTDDPRFVVFPRFNYPLPITTYWDMVRRGGLDFWFIVGETVAKQCSEKSKADCFMPVEYDSRRSEPV